MRSPWSVVAVDRVEMTAAGVRVAWTGAGSEVRMIGVGAGTGEF